MANFSSAGLWAFGLLPMSSPGGGLPRPRIGDSWKSSELCLLFHKDLENRRANCSQLFMRLVLVAKRESLATTLPFMHSARSPRSLGCRVLEDKSSGLLLSNVQSGTW